MASKKKTGNKTPHLDNSQALKIGSRVRCTDDGVTGRITWANGVSLKIKWDDGEQVTWKRDSLAMRPVEILDADDAAGADGGVGALTAAAQSGPSAQTAAPDTQAVAPSMPDEVATETATSPAEKLPVEEAAPTPGPVEEPAAPAPLGGTTEPPAKAKRHRKVAAEPREKKVGALDAAVRVLAEEGRPLTCKELIAAMAAKRYWTSPGGKTPDATLYSAILRELAKGEDSRFVKAEKGKFTRKA